MCINMQELTVCVLEFADATAVHSHQCHPCGLNRDLMDASS
jgi:hypothetical protein